MGALSLLKAAVDPEVKGGEYYSPAGRFGGNPVRIESSEASHNEEDAKKLWEVSESLTSIKIPIFPKLWKIRGMEMFEITRFNTHNVKAIESALDKITAFSEYVNK